MNKKTHNVADTSVQQITNATSAENIIEGTYAHTALTNPPNTVINKSFWREINCTIRSHYISRLAIAKLPDNIVEKELPPVTITLDDLKPLSFDVVGHKDAIVTELLSHRIMLASNKRIRKSTIVGGINIYTMVVVDPFTGITLKLNSLLMDYLYQQKSYLNASPKYIATLPDLSTAKLYEFLLYKMQQYGEPLLRFYCDDLASFLGYTPKGAFTPCIFVSSVIKPAVDAINRATNCRISIKCEREYKDIRFLVEAWKTREEKQEAIQDEEYWLDPARTMEEESSIKKHKATLCMKAAREQALETGEGESFAELSVIKDY